MLNNSESQERFQIVIPIIFSAALKSFSIWVPHQKPSILVFANTQRKVRHLATGHSELAIKTQFKARSSLFHVLYYICPKCYSVFYTHITKKCCNVNTVRESSNWMRMELNQLPSMHNLCVQAQQKLCIHQKFYTELVQHLQTRREAWIYQNQNRWWQDTNFQSSRFLTSSPPLQLLANLSGWHHNHQNWLPQDAQNQSDRQTALKL